MKQYVCVAVLFMTLVAAQAQVKPGGETEVKENDEHVEEAKRLVVQEAKDHAKTLEGAPSVELQDVVAKKQTVAGTRYNFTFKAVYTYKNGEKATKSCTASLLKPLPSNDPSGKITFIKKHGENIHCA